MLFYVCSLTPLLPQHFVVQLLERAGNTATPQLQRQTAMAYVGSFVARGQYVAHAPMTLPCVCALPHLVRVKVRPRLKSHTDGLLIPTLCHLLLGLSI